MRAKARAGGEVGVGGRKRGWGARAPLTSRLTEPRSLAVHLSRIATFRMVLVCLFKFVREMVPWLEILAQVKKTPRDVDKNQSVREKVVCLGRVCPLIVQLSAGSQAVGQRVFRQGE